MFTVDRVFLPKGRNFTRGPAVANILQFVVDLSEAKAATLSDAELNYADVCFKFGFGAVSILQGSASLHQLVPIARGNLSAAVEHLTHQNPQYGESKWASLQMSEKVLKAAIELGGGSFTKTHKLADLFDQATTLGISGDWGPLQQEIQCSPGIRYGEEQCDRRQAQEAHHASLQLLNMLVKAGAKLRSSHALTFEDER